MNNNRNNNNNRRRGRNNRQQGGGNQNRIDSRARGNAPQMLDKYKKLAQDAQHNGDRVQAEYYLQFADHYFRVIADNNRSRQDDTPQRAGRPDTRDFQSDYDGDDDDFDGARYGREDRPREDRPREDRPREERSRDDRPREERTRDDRPRDDRPRDDRPRDDSRARGDRARSRPRRDEGSEGDAATQQANEFEPADNPFIRPPRTREAGQQDAANREPGTRESREPRRARSRRSAGDDTDTMVNDAGEIDSAALPPAFLGTPASSSSHDAERGTDDAGDDTGEVAARKPAPRRRRKAADDGEGESLTAVG